MCLWGNSTDLSLLIDMTEEDIKRLQSTGGDALAATEKNILGNDSSKLWDLVSTMKGARIGGLFFHSSLYLNKEREGLSLERRRSCRGFQSSRTPLLTRRTFPSFVPDFVLDNAGFELYCDFVYADWLIQSGTCSEVRFHGKTLPWFVSDVTRKDFNWLLNTCVYGQLFPNSSDEELESLRVMGRRWKVSSIYSTRLASPVVLLSPSS